MNVVLKQIVNTVGPRLSGHQLSRDLYYPTAILQCMLSIFHSFPHKILLKTKLKWMNFCFISNDNLLQIQWQ